MIMALVPPKWKTTIYQVNKSQMFYILSSRCYISTMASSEINTSWGKFELARCPSNLLDRATLLRELCPGHFQLHQDPLHHEMLRLTLKQAHIQQLRLLNSKAFLFASCYFDGFYWCFFLRMTLKIHLSLQDSCPKSWSILFAGRPEETPLHRPAGQGPTPREKGTRSTPCEDVILYLLLKTKYGLNTPSN